MTGNETTITHYCDLIDRAPPLALEEHYRLNEELWQIEHDNASDQLPNLTVSARREAIYARKRASTIVFADETEFAAFCTWRGGQLASEYEHEAEHAEIYKRYGIPCVFGFIKIEHEGHVGLLPWVTPHWPAGISAVERMRITLEALENATEKSEGDKQDIAAIKRLLS